MTYNPLKPDSGPSPLVDAPTIQTNFAQFAAIFSRTAGGVIYNHTPLNDNNQGDHEAILLEKQTADPGVTQLLDALYCKDATSNAGTQPQLFVQIPKFLPTILDTRNAPNNPMQLTYNAVNTAGPIYQSFLAGGYLVFFGTTNNIALNITLSPAPTTLLLAIAEPQNVLAGNTAFDVTTNIINNSTFKINSISAIGVYTFSWIAIGTV